jgi:hypothetical protein
MYGYFVINIIENMSYFFASFKSLLVEREWHEILKFTTNLVYLKIKSEFLSSSLLVIQRFDGQSRHYQVTNISKRSKKQKYR